MSEKKRWICLYVENEIGVLARISGLFSGKSYNLNSLTVGETEDTTISRMTISFTSDDRIFEQVKKQLNRSVEVIKVVDYTDIPIHNKEILFIKVKECNTDDKDEVFRIADDITVFRDGTVVKSMRAEDTNIDEVIALMVGRRMENVYPKENIEIGEPLLEVKDLKSGQLFEDVTFHVGKGEIVGFAGLVGAGRTEVMRCLFGLDPIDGGTVKVHGKEIKIKRVADATKAGMVMLSEDRRRYGIIPMRSVRENASLAALEKFFYGGHAHRKEEEAMVAKYFDKMSVKTPTQETPIQSLSGGNQQKVLLAKWMMRDPEVLILDEPTRGIDVGAKFEIYKLMTEVAQAGKAVVMVSSELPELIGMCDRIYVMNQGHIAGELKREEFSQEAIMVYATGTHSIIQE